LKSPPKSCHIFPETNQWDCRHAELTGPFNRTACLSFIPAAKPAFAAFRFTQG
jgi:hypothetical protein